MTPDITGTTRQENDNAFLLYHAASHVTGERLGDYLGVPHGRGPPADRNHFDYLIRWGHRGSGPRSGNSPLNPRSAIRNASDKYQTLEALDNSGINVPEFSRDMDDLEYPILGRKENGARGEDLVLILQQFDDQVTSSDFYTEYIPTEREYRAHVIDGEVVQMYEKRLRHEADVSPTHIRNSENGWVFLQPREEAPPESVMLDAVGSLGLDFGAVDCIRGEDGEFYVLEVNTAPSLDEANLRRFGDRFAELCNVNSVAGMEAVDWDDDD